MPYEYIATIAGATADDNNNGMRLIPLVLLSKMDLLYQSLKMTEGSIEVQGEKTIRVPLCAHNKFHMDNPEL